jgi:hypothetical protein
MGTIHLINGVLRRRGKAPYWAEITPSFVEAFLRLHVISDKPTAMTLAKTLKALDEVTTKRLRALLRTSRFRRRWRNLVKSFCVLRYPDHDLWPPITKLSTILEDRPFPFGCWKRFIVLKDGTRFLCPNVKREGFPYRISFEEFEQLHGVSVFDYFEKDIKRWLATHERTLTILRRKTKPPKVRIRTMNEAGAERHDLRLYDDEQLNDFLHNNGLTLLAKETLAGKAIK